jgi:hypothetical protein
MLKEILFCGDFSESVDRVFTHALYFAKTCHSKLLILHAKRNLVYPEQVIYYLSFNKQAVFNASQTGEVSQKNKIPLSPEDG